MNFDCSFLLCLVVTTFHTDTRTGFGVRELGGLLKGMLRGMLRGIEYLRLKYYEQSVFVIAGLYFYYITAPMNIPSSSFPAEIPRTDLCFVSSSTFMLCSCLVRSSMVRLTRVAKRMLSNPVAPAIPTMLFSSPSTPKTLRR